MPRGDRTGPMGLGPMTGRAAGYCAGYSVPGFMNPWGGRFFGGWGRGRGYRNWYYATGLPGWARFGGGFWGVPPVAPTPAPEAEAEFLRQQAQQLRQTLEEIEKRLDDLESKED